MPKGPKGPKVLKGPGEKDKISLITLILAAMKRQDFTFVRLYDYSVHFLLARGNSSK